MLTSTNDILTILWFIYDCTEINMHGHEEKKQTIQKFKVHIECSNPNIVQKSIQ